MRSTTQTRSARTPTRMATTRAPLVRTRRTQRLTRWSALCSFEQYIPFGPHTPRVWVPPPAFLRQHDILSKHSRNFRVSRSSEAFRSLARAPARYVAIVRKIDEVDRSVNALYAARAGLPLLCGGRSPTSFSRTLLTPPVRYRWRSQIFELGPPPSISERHSCFNDVLKCRDACNLDQISSRRPYDTEQVRVAKDGGVHPKRVQDVVHAAIPVVMNPDGWIFRSDSELSDFREDDLPRAYTDPFLKNPRKMRELVLLLHRAEVLGFRRKARAKVGVFTVTKSKAGQLRCAAWW